jgi:hypothetical protein
LPSANNPPLVIKPCWEVLCLIDAFVRSR